MLISTETGYFLSAVWPSLSLALSDLRGLGHRVLDLRDLLYFDFLCASYFLHEANFPPPPSSVKMSYTFNFLFPLH